MEIEQRIACAYERRERCAVFTRKRSCWELSLPPSSIPWGLWCIKLYFRVTDTLTKDLTFIMYPENLFGPFIWSEFRTLPAFANWQHEIAPESFLKLIILSPAKNYWGNNNNEGSLWTTLIAAPPPTEQFEFRDQTEIELAPDFPLFFPIWTLIWMNLLLKLSLAVLLLYYTK